jgi:hypothetical protein
MNSVGMSVASVFDPVFATPMDQLQKGILDVLRYMKQDPANEVYLKNMYRGIPFVERMDKIIRLIEEAEFHGSFRSVLEDTSVFELGNTNRGATGGTRSKRNMSGGVNKRAILLNVLLLIGEWYAFHKVFQNAVSKLPMLENGSIDKDPSKYNFLINTDSIKLTTIDGQIAILSGLMMFMMFTAGLLMNQFESKPREKVNRIEVIVNNTRRSGGAMNLYQQFQKVLKFINSIPLNAIQQSAIRCLESLLEKHPENPTLQSLLNEARTLTFEGQLGIQEGGGASKLKVLFAIILYILNFFPAEQVFRYAAKYHYNRRNQPYEIYDILMLLMCLVYVMGTTLVPVIYALPNNIHDHNEETSNIDKIIELINILYSEYSTVLTENIIHHTINKINKLPKSTFEEKECFDPMLAEEIIQDPTTTRLYLMDENLKLIYIACLDKEAFDAYFPQSKDIPKYGSLNIEFFQNQINREPENQRPLMQEEQRRRQEEIIHCNETIVYKCVNEEDEILNALSKMDTTKIRSMTEQELKQFAIKIEKEVKEKVERIKEIPFRSIPFYNRVFVLDEQIQMLKHGGQYILFPTNRSIGKIESDCFRKGGSAIGAHHCQEYLTDRIHFIIPMPKNVGGGTRKTRKAQRRQRSRRSRNK